MFSEIKNYPTISRKWQHKTYPIPLSKQQSKTVSHLRRDARQRVNGYKNVLTAKHELMKYLELAQNKLKTTNEVHIISSVESIV